MKKINILQMATLFKGCPKIIRLDGKSFGSFLKTAKKPYDKAVIDALIIATQALIKEIGGSAHDGRCGPREAHNDPRNSRPSPHPFRTHLVGMD